MLHTLVNVKKWNELPKSYQAALTAACGEATAWMPAKYDAQNPPALHRLVSGGTKLRPFPKVVMEACEKAAFELYGELMSKSEHWNADLSAMEEIPRRAVPVVSCRRVYLRQLRVLLQARGRKVVRATWSNQHRVVSASRNRAHQRRASSARVRDPAPGSRSGSWTGLPCSCPDCRSPAPGRQ